MERDAFAMESRYRDYLALFQAHGGMPLLRPNLHVEIGLPRKSQGIVASASWG